MDIYPDSLVLEEEITTMVNYKLNNCDDIGMTTTEEVVEANCYTTVQIY